jgi:hypothetical protein
MTGNSVEDEGEEGGGEGIMALGEFCSRMFEMREEDEVQVI